jgi:hypothetical protein
MGIKLEVGKRYRDGYGKPRPIVMRFSASVYMAHDGAKYSDTGKRLVEYEYDSRFDLIAPAPDETPEAQPDELAALRAENARLRDNSRDLWTATTALLAWVDAVPSEALRGETLPGIDLDWINGVVARIALTAKEPK